MPASIVVGLQWGDEGKGKTTDFLAEQVSMVVRYQGGDNAGHTVVKGDEVLKLHLVPSGVLYPHITSVIGPGVVVNPQTLIQELDGLSARGVDVSRVRVSRASHLVLPYHIALDKARTIAGHQLEVSEEDLDYDGGRFAVKGSADRGMTVKEAALAAWTAHNLPDGLEPGLEATYVYDPPNFSWPAGAHAAVVEVDTETGEVDFLRYVAVDDVGAVINPTIVDGQIHGGIAQGVAQALWEEAVYDEDGNLLTGSLLNYLVPTAAELPSFELDRTTTPSPTNPLGVKGVGETGTIASPAAVMNAVVDAVAHLGVETIEMPATPERVWRALQEAKR